MSYLGMSVKEAVENVNSNVIWLVSPICSTSLCLG